MLAAFAIIAGFVFPIILALTAAALSLAAVKRHVTVRQILLTGLVWISSVAAVVAMTGNLANENSLAGWPLVVLAVTLIFSIFQFAAALLLGAVARLKHLAGRQLAAG